MHVADSSNLQVPDKISRILEHLRQRWAETDREVLRHVFPLLPGGSVSIEALSRASGIDAARTALAANSGRVDRDHAGAISGLFGITLQRATYRIEGGGGTLFACCALVAHTAPFLLRQRLFIHTQDPVTGNTITLELSARDRPLAKPAESMATLVMTDAAEMAKDVSSHFCTHVRHFESEVSASRFTAQEPRRFIIGLEGIQEVARRLVALIWR